MAKSTTSLTVGVCANAQEPKTPSTTATMPVLTSREIMGWSLVWRSAHGSSGEAATARASGRDRLSSRDLAHDIEGELGLLGIA